MALWLLAAGLFCDLETSLELVNIKRTRCVCEHVCNLELHQNDYKNTPIQIYRKFHLQKLKIFRLKTLIFSFFYSKHRLSVLVRTASPRGF